MSDVPAPKTQKRVLIVDDNLNTRNSLRDILILEGYAVSEAKDGVEAIRIIVLARPDLVVMDLDMPRLDGRNTIKLLRENAGPPRVPIVVLSGSDAENLEHDLKELGADGYIKKGRNIGQLVERVKALLSDGV